MLRVLTICLFLVSARADTDAFPISLDDTEGAKAGRLMKKGGIDIQSNYHEGEIKDTGFVHDKDAARLVKNRGPITAKIIANGSHARYCEEEGEGPDCVAKFSLVAWKFAGDNGQVNGSMEEVFKNGEVLKVNVDCLYRKDHEAIVGGVVTQIHKGGRQELLNSRAYVKVSDNSDSNTIDDISDLTFGWGQDTSCKTHDFDDFQKVDNFKMASPRAHVCSKHGDWEGCIEKSKKE